MSWESGALLFQSSKEKGFLFSVQGKDLQKKPKAEKVLEFQEAYEFSKKSEQQQPEPPEAAARSGGDCSWAPQHAVPL